MCCLHGLRGALQARVVCGVGQGPTRGPLGAVPARGLIVTRVRGLGPSSYTAQMLMLQTVHHSVLEYGITRHSPAPTDLGP